MTDALSSRQAPAAELPLRSVAAALDVLEYVAAHGEVGVTTLAQAMRSPKGTVFRHAQTLTARGYLERTPEARYRLGVGAYLLGLAAANQVDLLSAARQPIQTLVEATGQSVVLSSIGERGVVVLQTVFGSSPIEIGVRANSLLSLHASAQGKVALAFAPDLTDPERPLQRFTDHTITDAAALSTELEVIRSRGWATAPEEMLLGLNGLAAPVRDAAGRCVGTIAIVGSVQHVPPAPPQELVRAVVDAAEAVSVRLGFSSGR